MKPKFHKKILKNGMTVLFEKRKVPVVSVAFAVRSGGINEISDEKGISHFIEHMLYKGTPTRNAKKIAEEIEKKGGVLNGFTDEEITAFWCKMPSKHLATALDVLSDVIRNPLFDKEEIEKERKVIFEEIKMRKDNPPIYVFDKIQSYLYGEPFGFDLIGTYDTMSSIGRKKLVDKFKQIYQPKNMIFCVVGDADFHKIVKFAEDNFREGGGKITEIEVITKNESRREKRKGIDQANMVFAHHVPLATESKNYAAQVLSAIMAEGMSSRLFYEIREKRNLAYAVKGNSNINKKFAYNYIYAGTTKENVEKVKEIVLREFDDVAKNLGEEELKQIKEQLIGNYHISMEDSQSQMANLLLAEIRGDAKEFYDFEKNIQNVKIEDVKELAGKAMKNYSLFVLVPE